MLGAKRECEQARADQLSKARAAETLQHRGVAQYYRQQNREINDLETSLQGVLDGIQTGIQEESPKIFTDLSVLLGLFEQYNLVGYNARPFLVRRIINATRRICEETTSPTGHFLVWFRQVYNLVDTLFQTRVALSLFYHTVQE